MVEKTTNTRLKDSRVQTRGVMPPVRPTAIGADRHNCCRVRGAGGWQSSEQYDGVRRLVRDRRSSS